MLTKDEEKKVINYLKKISELGNLDAQMYYWMTAREFKWLAEKLKEINDECSVVHLELQKTNEYSARLTELYYGT